MPSSLADSRVAGVKLAIYENRFCGYCMDVRQVIAELGLDVQIRSVADDETYLNELYRATGRTTVPVLKIEHDDGSARWLPESSDIISYLYSYAGVPRPRLRLRPYTLLRAALVVALLVVWIVAARF